MDFFTIYWIRNLFYPKISGDSKNNGHHGILEFSTEKAGQDVTPMNLDFPDTSNGTHSQKRAMNSISGKCLNSQSDHKYNVTLLIVILLLAEMKIEP